MRTWLRVTCALIVGLSLLPSKAEARRKVVLVVMDGVTWEDCLCSRAPNLARLIREGAVGLMNTRTAGRPTREAAYLTLGAGARATADMSAEQAGWCGSADDAALLTLAGTFQARTRVSLAAGAVGCWAAPLLRTENKLQPYAAVPGLLGQALKAARRNVACLGNADVTGNPRRPAALIAMDSAGVVPLGFVGDVTARPDPDFPGGLRTDLAALHEAFHRLLGEADFVVVDLGDTGRLAAIGEWIAPDVYAARRREAIARADTFLGQVRQALDRSGDLLLVVTPASPEDPSQPPLTLTPIVLWGKAVRGGLVTSASTRTPGLVSNVDVAPTVLQWLGVGLPEGMTGRPISAMRVGAGEKMPRILRFEATQKVLEGLRMPVLHAVAYCMAAALAIAGIAALLEKRSPRWLCCAAKGGLVLLLAAVPAIIAAPVLGLQGATGHGVSIGAFLIGFLVLSFALRRLDLPVVLWGAAGAIALADVLLGGRLMQESLLGYSPAMGARFYGMGNECGGVVVAGSAAVGMALIGWRNSAATRAVLAAGLLGVCLVVGHPAIGANFGMAAATATSAGVALYLVWPARRPRLAAAVAVGAVILVAAAVIAVDLLLLGPAQSHIGRVFQGGPSAISEVAARKLAKNFMLLENSPWTWPLVAAASVVLALVISQPGGLVAALRQRSSLAAMLTAISAGGAAALLLNDSGVVPAALSLFFAAAALCYWVIYSEG